MKILIVAPYLNRDGLGEGYSIFKWVEALADVSDVTVMALTGNFDLAEQLPNARVLQTRSPGLPSRLTRFDYMAKPWLPFFFRKVRGWIRKEQATGVTWDIAHQVLPQAMRYATPLAGMGIPYVIGPLGGSLSTPDAFQDEVTDSAVFRRLRSLDSWRLRKDRKLRQGYEGAAMILGVAPYVADTLRSADIRVQRFEPILERAHEGTFPQISRTSGAGEAHLLHVGRVVRTKGLRDAIRALAEVRDLSGVRLTSAGDGPDLEACRAEAKALGVDDRVTFLGRVPRAEVDQLYAEADIFCFPSFREPMGGVFFEAMEYALPVITANRGGPAFILNDDCAIRLPVETKAQFSGDIAAAIRQLAEDPERRRAMGAAAAARLQSFGGWPDKAETLLSFYRDVLETG